MLRNLGLAVALTTAVSTALGALSVASATAGGTSAGSVAGHTRSGMAYSLDRTLSDARITESSGLAPSTRGRDVVFTHNDSGDGAHVYAVGARGRTKAVITLAKATSWDWEDISTGPGNTLWVGDIGDNRRRKDSIRVYRFTEPRTLTNTTIVPTKYELVYPDGARDAEALMVHPRSGRIFVVSKVKTGGAIYRAPKVLSTTQRNRLVRVASAPATVTAASFAPDGRSVVLSTYGKVYVSRTVGGAARMVAKPQTRQGESITVDRTSSALLIGSEGGRSPVYRMRLPRS